MGGPEIPFGSYQALQACSIYGTKWSVKRFSFSLRSPTDQIRTSFPASTVLNTGHITSNYTFRHELVASYVNSVPPPIGGGGGAAPPATGGGYLTPFGGGGAGFVSSLTPMHIMRVEGVVPAVTALQYTRHMSTRAPYSRSPLQIDPNAVQNATLGATIPVLCGTVYACPGVVLAQSATERMIKVADHAIHSVFDAVNSSGARASQSYHFHAIASVTTTTTVLFVIPPETGSTSLSLTSGVAIANGNWIAIADGTSLVVASVTSGGGTAFPLVQIQQIL